MNTRLQDWFDKGAFFQYKDKQVFYISEGSGNCLLIIHGYPYSGYDFKLLLPKLASSHKVLLPDMIGMGFSDKPSAYQYSFEEHVSMYRCLLQFLNITEVHILAHDLGNSIAQELLSQWQEGDHTIKIRSIAFLNGGLFSDVYRPRTIQVLLSRSPSFIGKTISRLIPRNSVEKATRSVFGKNTQPSKELLDDFWQILNYKNGKSLAWKIGRLVFEKDKYQQRWIKVMQRTNIPMCLINGPADPNSGMHMAKRYRELIPHADVRILNDDIGHWPQLEAPEEVLLHYSEFLRSSFVS